jgi:hypothetical protein
MIYKAGFGCRRARSPRASPQTSSVGQGGEEEGDVVVTFGAGGGRVVTVAIDGKLQGLGVGPLTLPSPDLQPNLRARIPECVA